MTVKKLSKTITKPSEKTSGIETVTTDSAFLAACAGHSYTKNMFQSLDVNEMSEMIKADVDKVNKDDLSGLVGMLVSQAHTLQLMFTHLARRANGFEQLSQYQAFMGMALKTQAQSRATIQAVADLKFPRQVIVTKQANISQGHQQVNNGNAPSQSMPVTHAGSFKSEQNELLENVSNEEEKRLDIRTPIEAITDDSKLATMATLNGRKNS